MGDLHSFFEARSEELDIELDRVMKQWEILAERKPFLHPEVYEALMKGIGDRSQEILNGVRELRAQTVQSLNPKKTEKFAIMNTL